MAANYKQLYLRIRPLIIGVVISFSALICLEGPFFILNHYKKYKQNYSSKNFLNKNYKPYSQDTNIATEVFHFESTSKIPAPIDKYAFRITPIDSLLNRHKYALFLGCSFTWGEGVNPNETMPFYFGELANEYKPYNLGIPGRGTQQMLEILQALIKSQENKLTKELRLKQGILIYTFIDSHIPRVIGSMRVSIWGYNMPCYTIDDRDNLIKKGTFLSAKPFLTLFYNIIGREQIARYLKLDVPKINEGHIRLVYRIIKESAGLLKNKFQNDNFYVLIYPGSLYGKRLIPYFKQGGIKYLDYSNLDFKGLPFRLRNRHPSPLAYKVLAERITKDLGIYDAAIKD